MTKSQIPIGSEPASAPILLSPEPPPASWPKWFWLAFGVWMTTFGVISEDAWEKSGKFAMGAASVVILAESQLNWGVRARTLARWMVAVCLAISLVSEGVMWYHRGWKPTDWVGVIGVLPLALVWIWGFVSRRLIKRSGSKNATDA